MIDGSDALKLKFEQFPWNFVSEGLEFNNFDGNYLIYR